MILAEQFTLDLNAELLDTQLRAQWAANAADQASRWHEDDYARSWCGIQSRELWETLPRYERDRIVRMYNWEQGCLDRLIVSWQEQGGYLCEKFFPDGHSERWPRKPFRIPDYKDVQIHLDPKQMADDEAAAKAMADQLAADWSAGRPASIQTYNPFQAMRVSSILGKTVESVMPEDRSGVPIVWQFVHYMLHPEQASTSTP